MAKVDWYAVRTLPGAQQPKREYWPEDAPKTRKGYRIRSGIASDHSAVELALKDAGFTYYMPVEFAVVRNRHKKGFMSFAAMPFSKATCL